MGYSKEKIKQICGLMVFAAFLVLLVMYSNLVVRGAVIAVEIARPFLVGGMIAFVLNLPMKAIERSVLSKWKGKIADKCKRPVSMLLAIVVVVLIVAVVIATVVPQISETITVLGNKIPAFFDKAIVWLESLTVNYPELEAQVENLRTVEINWDSLMDSAMAFLKNGVGNVLTSTVSVASSIIGGVVEGVISFIFALYILSQKEILADQGKRIINAYCSERAAANTLKVLSLLHKNFSSFITGQCVEAVILGTMFIVTMSIFKMPYAFMVGVLIAFTSLIPVVGAFIGCAVGAFLILIENPVMALWFLLLFLILQQIEGNLIYPKVVGNSVGLPSIWVLMAVSLGGSLFGVAGMLFFIPLLATCYCLLRENVNARNACKMESAKEAAKDEMKEDAKEENEKTSSQSSNSQAVSRNSAGKRNSVSKRQQSRKRKC